MDEDEIPLGGPEVPKVKEKPVPAGHDSVPQTGDSMPVLPLIIIFVVSLLSTIGLFILRRKRFS